MHPTLGGVGDSLVDCGPPRAPRSVTSTRSLDAQDKLESMHHQKSRRSLLSILVLGSSLSAACSETASPALNEARQSLVESSHYDAEALLAGLFFGVGPASKLLPEVWENRRAVELSPKEAAAAYRAEIGQLDEGPEQLKQREAIADAIERGEMSRTTASEKTAGLTIRSLLDKDPDFAGRFEKQMYSGNPVAVSAAVEEAGKRLSEFLELEVVKDPGRYGSDYVVNENVAINVNAALNVNVAANVDYVWNVTHFWSRPDDIESRVKNEMVIAELTARFASL